MQWNGSSRRDGRNAKDHGTESLYLDAFPIEVGSSTWTRTTNTRHGRGEAVPVVGHGGLVLRKPRAVSKPAESGETTAGASGMMRSGWHERAEAWTEPGWWGGPAGQAGVSSPR
jgi:hypothetical protein